MAHVFSLCFGVIFTGQLWKLPNQAHSRHATTIPGLESASDSFSNSQCQYQFYDDRRRNRGKGGRRIGTAKDFCIWLAKCELPIFLSLVAASVTRFLLYCLQLDMDCSIVTAPCKRSLKRFVAVGTVKFGKQNVSRWMIFVRHMLSSICRSSADSHIAEFEAYAIPRSG